MFNWEEFAKRKTVHDNYEKIIEAITNAAEALLDQKNILDPLVQVLEIIDEQKIYYDNGCKHNLILHYGKERLDVEPNGYAECVCCQRTFHLTEEEIEAENVLDLMGHIPEKYLCMDEGTINILKKRVLEFLYTIKDEHNGLIFLQDIKKVVLEDLIRFTEDQEYQKKMVHVPAPTTTDYVNNNRGIRKEKEPLLSVIKAVSEEILVRTRNKK